MAISDAVGLDRLSAVLGYKLIPGNFAKTSGYLPQRIAILSEVNHANQSGLSTIPVEVTSAAQAAALFGDGSPAHIVMNILRPYSGDGVGGIPTIIYPIAEAAGAAAKVVTITPSGTATANVTHRLVINGRTNINGVGYDVNIVTGDTATVIGGKIQDAINNVFGCPFTGAADSGTGVVTATTNWYGLSANDCTISIDTSAGAAGVSYSIATTTAGSGAPSISSALTSFANQWNTLVIVGCSTADTTAMTALENYNGVPDAYTPTGRWAGLVMKPFVVFVGSTADNPTSFTDARKTQCTRSLAPAPLSKGLPMEAAANMAYMESICAQNTPHLDVTNRFYPDMPLPPTGSTPAMLDYNNRDSYVKKGCSTVTISNGKWKIKDVVTTYHPDGEVNPAQRWVRNILLDMNVYYQYRLLEQESVENKMIANDGDAVSVSNVITPNLWKADLGQLFETLTSLGFIADPDFSKASIQVGIGSSNPKRFETFFRYKRTETVGIASTTAQAGFNFGNV
jgi:phage tail sheath gpL-like